MPTYFYHLAFELYPRPHPHPHTASSISTVGNVVEGFKAGNETEGEGHSESESRRAQAQAQDKEKEKDRARKTSSSENSKPFLPPPGTDIFESSAWPRHAALKEARDWSTRRLAESSYGVQVQNSGVDRVGVVEQGIGAAEAEEDDEEEKRVIEKRVIEKRVIEKRVIEKGEEIRVKGGRHEKKQYLPQHPRDQSIAATDWRYNAVSVEAVDMEAASAPADVPERPGRLTRGESSAGRGAVEGAAAAAENVGRVTQARFVPVGRKNTEVGWGVVHLYRDEEGTTGLDGTLGEDPFGLGAGEEGEREDPTWDSVAEGKTTGGAGGPGGSGLSEDKEKEKDAEDCTTLCVLAVPSFFTASDFLSWVGHKTREQVSHFRMVMTGRVNRFLVLMKFRDGFVARKWRAEWDGKLFVAHEPETCHVMFIKSITFQTATSSRPNTSFPEISHDPFTPSNSASNILQPLIPTTTTTTTTSNLVELPTCPVCLERMDDDTSGLLTTPCQHVFHCDCLQKWRGTGCPVCRHTNASLVAAQFPNSAFSFDSTTAPFGSGEASLCSVCDCADDLWICLTCGKTGCGRYKGGHAKEHWKDTAHNFALEIETQHVWDYAEDVWVHRLLRGKGDSKVIELPSRRGPHGERERDEDRDLVPREKLESIGMEYTHLLTSQLESQRIYFEDQVTRAVSKAATATQAAASASSRADSALKSLSELQVSHAHLRDEVVADLERELARERRKAEKSAELARGVTRSLVEEKKVSEGLMARIGHVNSGIAGMSRELTQLKEENAELVEANRDLLFSITGGERLREMGEGQGLEEGEVEAGTVSLPAEKGRRKGKGKK